MAYKAVKVWCSFHHVGLSVVCSVNRPSWHPVWQSVDLSLDLFISLSVGRDIWKLDDTVQHEWTHLGCCAAMLVGEKTDWIFVFYLFLWLEGCFQVPGSIAYCHCQNQTVPSGSSTSLYSVAGEETFGHQPVRTGPDDHKSEALIL